MEINKTELKKILKEQRKEYQRYIGALEEDFDGKVKVIAEQYTDIKKTLDSHSKILDSHSKILEFHSRILASHSRILASIQEDIETTKVDIEFIKNSLKKKVDIEEFEALERRVALLEARNR